MKEQKAFPGNGGEHYVSYEERTGEESVVYFTRDLSKEGLRRIFERVGANMEGRVGIKLHTGEQNGPNIIPAIIYPMTGVYPRDVKTIPTLIAHSATDAICAIIMLTLEIFPILSYR